MKVKAHLLGTDALLRKFEAFGEDGIRRFKEVTRVAAEEIKESAKQNITSVDAVDTGKLRQSVFHRQTGKLGQRIFVAEKYAAFIEFGTGGLVDVPEGWESLAMQFKGKGIRQVNLPARPYLYPAFKEGSKQYLKDLEHSINKLTNKYNKR